MAAAGMAAFEGEQRVAKHHLGAARGAVAQKKPAFGFFRQNRAQLREDRGDARAGGESGENAPRSGLGGEAETARRCRHLDLIPGGKACIGQRRENPTRHLLHGDAEFAIAGRAANRIGAPDLGAIHDEAKRQILPRREAETLAQRRRHSESERNRGWGLAPHLADRQAMEGAPG